MPSLLKEIRDATVDANVPIANVLRKCAVLGDQLNNGELRDWALQELQGYKSEDEVPEYRKIGALLRGNLVGPQQSGYKNMPIPAMCLPEQLRDRADISVLAEGVAGLERLLEGEGDTLTFTWPGDWIARAQHKGQIMQGYVLYAAWQDISKSSVTGVLDAIRNRVLEFCLRLGKERPELMATDDDSPPTAADTTAARQVFNNVIIGSQIGNIASASPGATQSAQIGIIPGDMPGLMKALTGAGVPPDEAEALKAAIEQESGQTGKQKCDSWLERADQAVASGAWSLVSGATIATIRGAILSYLGLGSS